MSFEDFAKQLIVLLKTGKSAQDVANTLVNAVVSGRKISQEEIDKILSLMDSYSRSLIEHFDNNNVLSLMAEVHKILDSKNDEKGDKK